MTSEKEITQDRVSQLGAWGKALLTPKKNSSYFLCFQLVLLRMDNFQNELCWATCSNMSSVQKWPRSSAI